MILFEYPFNERIRAYLRLEFLFDRLAYFAHGDDLREHQIAVATLFDILEACERTDIKSAVLQDVERQRVSLASLRDHPDVAQDALEGMLRDMERTISALSAQGKTGQALRENEWLVSLRGRLAVPGGATQVDMPSYHAWQHKPAEVRRAEILAWAAPLQALQDCLSLAMRLLRESGRKAPTVAEQGGYQQMLGGKTYQMLRVWVDPQQGVFPEISANKYMVWIRFSTHDGELKPQPVSRNVSFDMSLCAI